MFCKQACRCLLSLTIPEGVDDVTKKGSGYSLFIDALLTLMSVGSDYSNGSKALCGRVLLACCAHQCFTLGMNLLGTLPPSYHTLLAMVEGEGLSVVVSVSMCTLSCSTFNFSLFSPLFSSNLLSSLLLLTSLFSSLFLLFFLLLTSLLFSLLLTSLFSLLLSSPHFSTLFSSPHFSSLFSSPHFSTLFSSPHFFSLLLTSLLFSLTSLPFSFFPHFSSLSSPLPFSLLFLSIFCC